MRWRYSRFTARLTVAGDTPKDLATLRWLTPVATIWMAAAFLLLRATGEERPVSCRLPPYLLQTRLGTAAKPARV